MAIVNGYAKNPITSITPLPVLIKSSDRLRLDGVAHFFDAQSTSISGMHVLSSKEASSLLDHWKGSRPGVWEMVRGIDRLQCVQKERDWSEFQKALDLETSGPAHK